jgi:uncharacterized protein (TIGR02246 family)
LVESCIIQLVGEQDVRALYDAVIASWNGRDGAAMAAPFADDAIVIGFDGSLSVGKETIAAEMASIFADHETARYAVKVTDVRPIGADVMLLRAIAGLTPPGQSTINPDQNAHQTVVAVRQDSGWKIVLYQNTPAQFHGRPELVEQMTQELQAVADA